MTDEKETGPAGDIGISEDSAEQPQENANLTADQQAGESPVDDTGTTSVPEEPDKDLKVANEGDAPEEETEVATMTMLEETTNEDSVTTDKEVDFDAASVAKAEFQHLSQPADLPETKNIDLLMDVNLPLSIELGRTKMSISDILSLGPGSVVELNKLAGEPVDVLVNSTIVAKGEVVVIDENFGVRITQLMTPEERLKLLGEER